MKKLEIKGIGTVSAFKATAYMMIIPSALLFLLGIILTMIAVVAQEPTLLALGIPYILMPVFLIGIYGAISMLVALLYGVLAKKFGGLELIVQEKTELDLTKGPAGNGYAPGPQSNFNPSNSPFNSGSSSPQSNVTPPPLPNLPSGPDQNSNT
ncbi:hypothetical protein SAMN04487969_11585 [Paenibacillus algorifonticola]|uniref:Uncharacterized protein n=1 Tax=Paenibacillus algorifonticola TaxID=684063 RepID=A0A1I2GDA5_9BACL|nr:hypothetical protein [Paenibacillus algorifonticola]SFF14651.1 hypothetical protein SAMN04487969_11585 [Paenibacillus algorifonticola]